MRYINTFVFLDILLAKKGMISFNRIGTHLIESLFGLTRLTAKNNGKWMRLLSCIVKSTQN